MCSMASLWGKVLPWNHFVCKNVIFISESGFYKQKFVDEPKAVVTLLREFSSGGIANTDCYDALDSSAVISAELAC